MNQTPRSLKGACVAPHHLASQVGRDVLQEGGNAIEAMMAMAAAIAVVYPHMNSLGGDGFWLIRQPDGTVTAIDACGPAAGAASMDWYQARDLQQIPSRGPEAALTVAGTVQGWQQALKVAGRLGGKMSLQRLLSPAATLASDGIAVTRSHAGLTLSKLDQLQPVPGFADTWLSQGQAPEEGSLLRQQRLAATLEQLAHKGLDDFYRGDIARELAKDLQTLGSPLQADDLATYQATMDSPLALPLKAGTLYNLKPPTPGLASLMILGLFERLQVKAGESFAHVHGLVEATKRAFMVRDRVCLDPAWTSEAPEPHLSPAALDELARQIDPQQALPWPHSSKPGDTVWLGSVDSNGIAVSFIQSIYWEFGSGVTLPGTGLLWQNRGHSFSLDPAHPNALQPGRKPLHTLNPALAVLEDGRVMPYGTMGGEGQPQTQAALFSRYALFGQPLQQAVSAPRWLLGRTWGEDTTRLKLENRFAPELIEQLRAAGHDPVVLETGFSDQMGHAGALARHPSGLVEGAADPRSDGAVAML